MLVVRREDEQQRTAHRKEPGRDGADTQQDDAKSRCFYVMWRPQSPINDTLFHFLIKELLY